MSDDFTKQLQENVVKHERLFRQQEKQREDNLKTQEIHRIDLYNEIIEITKAACLEAVRNGDYIIDNTERKLVGTLEFYHQCFDYAPDYFGISCFINEKKYHDFDTIKRRLKSEDILFIVCNPMEVDVSNIFDKLRNKKKVVHRLNYIENSKNIQLFTHLFQASISNSKIINVSEIPLGNYSPYNSAKRIFDFEIVF